MKMRRILFVCSFILTFFPLHAKDENTPLRTADLTKQKSSWMAVCSGGVVASPVETDYGFAVYNDGRMICAMTNTGKVLWQKAVNGRQSPYMSAFGDFLYVVSGTKKLNLVNPSGHALWTVDIGFEPVESPLTGYDGRVFVRGKNALACFGLNGIRKWMVKTANASKIPLLILNDGTLLAISDQLKDGKSTSIRVSPFGEVLESITFSGKIIAADSSPQGVLLSQEDETIGLCRIEKGSAVSKWVANSLAKKNFTAICPLDGGKETAFFAPKGKQAEVVIVDTLSGREINRFVTENCRLSSISYLRATENGFVLADEEHAYECRVDGTVLWSAQLPKKSKWTHLHYTENNVLVVFGKDWSMKGFVMNQTVEKAGKKSASKAQSYLAVQTGTGMTASSLNFERLSMEYLEEISKGFDDGNSGKNEEVWLNSIKREIKTYLADHSSVLRSTHDGLSYFTANPVYTQSLLTVLSKTGTTNFAGDFASLLSIETDPARLALTIQYAGKEAYDRNGEILQEFQNILTKRLTPRDVSSLRLVCDSTYEICRFMGRPALTKRGKDIITYLFYPQFDRGIRDYARQTLSRIMDLEL